MKESKKIKASKPTLSPEEVGRELLGSIERDHLGREWNPEDPAHVRTVATWGRPLCLEGKARRSLEAYGVILARRGDLDGAAEARERAAHPRAFSLDELARWISARISPWPERWERMVKAVEELEAHALLKEAGRLGECGSAWGRVLNLFWKGARGEVSRTYGLHRCKSRHCPTCGRTQQGKRADEIQKALELAGEWGITPENVRFLTLTVRNGQDIPTLKAKAHEAWAKLQRRRWWPRWVCMWFRGSETKTGTEGDWNFHMHIVLILWGRKISYEHLWDEWGSAVGERSQIDIDELHSCQMRDARKKGGVAAAARYVTKYIGKSEELSNLRGGPGGLAHYASATRRMRAFACGGAAPLFRRMAAVLLPKWATRAEGIREDAHLRAGVAACRVAEVDPETGETWEADPLPVADTQARAQALALAGPLLWQGEAGAGETVGLPCGPGRRWRRIGHNPVKGGYRTVEDHEKRRPMSPMHQLINGGAWSIEEMSTKTKAGKVMRWRVVLPSGRFAWRDVKAEAWARMAHDESAWGLKRRAAFQAWAGEKIGDMERLDAARAFEAAADQSETERRAAVLKIEGARAKTWEEAGRNFDLFAAAFEPLEKMKNRLSGPGLMPRKQAENDFDDFFFMA